MNKLLTNTLGVIIDGYSRIEVLIDDIPPKKSIGGIGRKYVYITKYDHAGRVDNRSLGLPADKAFELGKILISGLDTNSHANADA